MLWQWAVALRHRTATQLFYFYRGCDDRSNPPPFLDRLLINIITNITNITNIINIININIIINIITNLDYSREI